jgi:CBS domain-containing protein
MSKDAVTLDQEQTVGKAVELINDKRIGSVIVTQSGKPVGIFSERDIMRLIRKFTFRTAMEGETNLATLKLREAMSKPLVTTSPSATITDAYDLMIQKNIRHLPVIEGDKLVGMLAERDVFRSKRLLV